MTMIVIMINSRHFRCASSKKKNLPMRWMTKMEDTDPDVPSHMKLIVIPTIRHAANLRLQRRTAPSRQCTQWIGIEAFLLCSFLLSPCEVLPPLLCWLDTLRRWTPPLTFRFCASLLVLLEKAGFSSPNSWAVGWTSLQRHLCSDTNAIKMGAHNFFGRGWGGEISRGAHGLGKT